MVQQVIKSCPQIYVYSQEPGCHCQLGFIAAHEININTLKISA